MRLLPLLALLLLVASPAVAAPLFPNPRQSFTLPNGLRVVLIPTGQGGTMIDLLVADVGMRNEQKPAETEYTHLMEHLIFRGSKNFPADVVRRVYTEQGLYEQGFTTPDFTCYFRIFPTGALPQVSAIMADKLQNLEIAPDEYRAETGAVLGEYLGSHREPAAMLDAKLRELAFTVHPYRDTPDHLDALKRMPENMDRVMKFYRDYYVPGNMRLVLVGDFDPAHARRVVEATYGRLRPGTAELPKFTEPPQSAMREGAVRHPGDVGSELLIGYRIPPYRQDLKASAALELIEKLWFVEGGPLERKLVFEDATVTGLHFPEYYFGMDDSIFATRLKLKEGADPAHVRDSFFALVDDIGARGVDAERLERAKSEVRYKTLGRLDSLEGLAFTYMSAYFLDPDPDSVDRYWEAFFALTPDDVREAARRYLTRDRSTVVTLTGKGS